MVRVIDLGWLSLGVLLRIVINVIGLYGGWFYRLGVNYEDVGFGG